METSNDVWPLATEVTVDRGLFAVSHQEGVFAAKMGLSQSCSAHKLRLPHRPRAGGLLTDRYMTRHTPVRRPRKTLENKTAVRRGRN